MPIASPAALQEFTEVYVSRTPTEHVEIVGLDRIRREAEGILTFAAERAPGAVRVRVFTPEGESETVVEAVVGDSPFLIDSVTNAIHELGHAIVRSVHPIVGIVRDESGDIVGMEHARGSENRVSFQRYSLSTELEDAEREELTEVLEKVLLDVQCAVRDFTKMRGAVGHMIHLATMSSPRYSEAEIGESIAFLEWLLDDNFVFLGYREYEISETPDGDALGVKYETGLGILSGHDSTLATPRLMSELPAHRRERYESGFLLVVAKANSTSTVHRRARLDYVGLRVVNAAGKVVGEARLLGLFTSRAYMAEVADVPILRKKLDYVIEAEDLIEDSHDYKAAVALVNSIPMDELFTAPEDDLRDTVVGLLRAEDKSEIKLFVRPDHLARSVSIMVSMPRDIFSADLRSVVQDLFLERYGGESIDYQLALSEGDQARLHFTVWIAGGAIPSVPLGQLEDEVIELCRTWDDHVADYLIGEMDPDLAREFVAEWGPRLPDYYKSSTSTEVGAGDIRRLVELAGESTGLVIGLQQEPSDDPLTRLAIYSGNGRMDLSELMPVLEALGLRVLESVPTRLKHLDRSVFIHDFGVLGSDGAPLDLESNAERVAATVKAALLRETESDSLNRLVVTAGLDHHDVTILRAYRTYWRRVVPSFTSEYINDAFAEHPAIARRILDLFRARFDPASSNGAADKIRAEIIEALDGVRSLDQDRILRGFVGLISATVRTNAFRPEARSLALKFRSADVPDMPDPKPRFEIYVYAPDVEGIHLRGGMVARGGIRWSDRLEDYRSEVLGLMKAQLTKNAIIVPTGAKGGFVLRRPVGADEDFREAGRAAYTTFSRGLLDVTDNLVGGAVQHPPNVRIHDGEDPYLVVAADRGTATFSDTANGIAAEYEFWLGDAFASGGSIGYDHKALGITARGAWESVKRHFLDLGRDVMAEPFTVAGIGDMSGDVFGNGMLQSPHIRLVAAFDHRHIFIDPDPDAAATFAERQRLFDLPRSSWDDFDRSVLSEGGGVYARSEKEIALSPQARAALGTKRERFTPAELMHTILKAPVDLMWNGGIGTYVKARTESHADAFDHGNDAVRVNGRDLRCKVFGEGGNLGLTQLGRIEFARSGGRINTDFVDNSGGVDCSDREVNLKILLNLAVEQGELTEEERVALIAEVAEDVTERVLADNYGQARMLSKDVEGTASRMEAYEDLMVVLERDLAVDRTLEVLPDPEEMSERIREGEGLTRPELAVLMAHAKRQLRKALLASDFPDDPDFQDLALAYFPDKVVERFGHLIPEHRLRREIISTSAASHVVNSQGITFVNRMVLQAGASPEQVVRAFRIARELTGAEAQLEVIEGLGGSVEAEIRRELTKGVDTLVEDITRWYLANSNGDGIRETLDAASADFGALSEALATFGSSGWRRQRERRAARLVGKGVPQEIAARHAFQAELAHGPDILELASKTGVSPLDVATVFFHVGEAYRLDWLEQALAGLPQDTRWGRWGYQALEDDIIRLRREIAESVLSAVGGGDPTKAVKQYRELRSGAHQRLDDFLRTLQREGASDHAALVVAVRQLRILAV